MSVDTVKEEALEEANYVYKATEFGLTRPGATAINTMNQNKVINMVLKNDKLSDKEKITELRKLKSKFKRVQTWRVSHGNLIPVVDKGIKKKITDIALNKIDKNIEKLGGTIEEMTEIDGALNESNLEYLEEKNDGNDDKYVDKIKKILDKDTKDMTKEDILELDKNLKAVKNNHKKADIILLILLGLSGGLIGAAAAPLYPAFLATTVYMQTLINFGQLENPSADEKMKKVSDNVEKAFNKNSEKIRELNKKEELTDEEKELLKDLKKMNYKLAGLDQKLKRATYFNMKESEIDTTVSKTYLFESINERSLNDIIL